jgi:hypothetical protein
MTIDELSIYVYRFIHMLQVIPSDASPHSFQTQGWRLLWDKSNNFILNLLVELMGNTECCHMAKEDDYTSQIIEPIQVHPPKE